MTRGLHIRRLDADEPAFDIVARWRFDAFFAEDGITFQESRDALHAWMAGLGYEIALLAESTDNRREAACSCAKRSTRSMT
jgi:hypothetical protein